MEIKTFYGTGNLLEAGDIVVLNDKGALQASNTDNGICTESNG